MKNRLDALHIELYGNGQFQGYLKSVSTYYQKVESTPNKMEAKPYAKMETAQKDGELARVLTHGALTYNVG